MSFAVEYYGDKHEKFPITGEGNHLFLTFLRLEHWANVVVADAHALTPCVAKSSVFWQ